MLRRLTPTDVDVRARKYLVLLSEHRTAEAEARLLPNSASPESHAEFSKIDSIIGGQRLDSMWIVGVNVHTVNGTRRANLTYEIRSKTQLLLANVATIDTLESWYVVGLHVNVLEQPLETQTAFTLEGKSFAHIAWLMLTIMCALCTLGTAIWLATRRKMPERWRWVFLALVGVGSFGINWATGDTTIHVASIQVFGAAVMRAGPASPWMVIFSLPIGAAISLSRYRRWRLSLRAVETAPVDTTPMDVV